ncbi:copper-binding protein [Roseovarius sp. EL26]|uniref:copper-binding protein n=1 Tax=Roseovarius sp. EL26 TaxID=2126672 RepID=UPI000EA12E80|nr:copper-binding protein [Roseovarius sp. EL26]
MRNSILTMTFVALLVANASAEEDHSIHGAKHDGVQTEAIINSIVGNTVNLSHGPIPEIGWPAMTMDLQLIEGAEVGGVEESQGALITLEKGEDGMYAIRSLKPAE